MRIDGGKLKRILKSRDASVNMLAEVLGVNRCTLSGWINNRHRNMPLRAIHRTVRVLQLSDREIIEIFFATEEGKT